MRVKYCSKKRKKTLLLMREQIFFSGVQGECATKFHQHHAAEFMSFA